MLAILFIDLLPTQVLALLGLISPGALVLTLLPKQERKSTKESP